MVGEAFIEVLENRKFPIQELRPFASEKSEGLQLEVSGKSWEVQGLKDGCFKGLDLVFFSSGDDISEKWAPEAVKSGAFAIDNSAAFRMNPEVPLVVPEVNSHQIPDQKAPGIIANPNCSTIQLVVALNALKKFGLEDVKVATYQSVSGAGKAGVDELLKQSQEQLETGAIKTPPQSFAHPIAFNCIPHIGSFSDDGFCSEENKIQRETKKILELPDLKVSAFTVRVPSLNSHSEAVWVRLKKELGKDDIFKAFEDAPGVKLVRHDEPADYPTALTASKKEPVFVGRVHRDLEDKHTWMLWVVADNIWKGAALNGLQIAEKIYSS